MNDQEMIQRIRSAGESGEACRLEPGPILEEAGRRHHTRRRRGGVLVGAAVMVPALAFTLTVVTDEPDTRTPRADHDTTRAETTTPPDTKTPAHISMAPGCPPDPPILMSSTDAGAEPLRRGLTARAGTDLTLSVRIPPSPPDRELTSVTFIVARNTKATYNRLTLLKPANQLAKVEVADLTPSFATTLHLPPELPPGEYPIAAYATFPGPAICGLPNDPQNTTMDGSSWGQVGTVKITE